ncbi:MAG: LysR family transcriptional regulator [Pseudomonadota bacterium]
MEAWDDLRFALAVAREGGLSGAARRLSVTHATVSRRLDRLEARLGRRLFERGAAGLVPTEAGRRVAAEAERVEASLHGLDRDLAGRDELAGPLVVTLPPALLTPGLSADLAAFAAARPTIELTVLGDNRLASLHRREADVALRVTRAPAESLWGLKVSPQRAAWFGRPGMGSAAPRIVFTPSRGATPEATGPAALFTDDMLAAVAFARAGGGIARLPLAIGGAAPELARVARLRSVDFSPIWLLTHPDLRRAPRVRAFMDFAAAAFAARREEYAGEGD